MKMNLASGKPLRSAAKGAAMANISVMRNLGIKVFSGLHRLNNFIAKPREKARTSPTKI